MNTQNNESAVKKEGFSEMKINGILILAIGVIITAAFCFMNSGAKKVSEKYRSAYDESYNAAYSSTYDNYVNAGFNKGYEDNHVKNIVDIQIVDVEKCSNLEVMKVSNFDYAISNSSDNSENIDYVFEVTVTGTYCVNMQLSEFLIDNKNKTVTVRVPYPSLTDFEPECEMLYFSKNGKALKSFSNGNYREGVDFARQQLMECRAKIENDLQYDQANNLKAEEMARNTLTNIIMRLNPDEPDLKVIVEFDNDILSEKG